MQYLTQNSNQHELWLGLDVSPSHSCLQELVIVGTMN